jgi:KDO2-lipid IV(A) lauroyltransferase
MNPQRVMSWGSVVAASMPRAVAEALADSLATMAATMPRQAGLRHLRDNLHKVLPEVSPGLLRAALRSYGRYYLGIMRLSRSDVDRAIGPVHWVGDAWLEDSLRRGRGAVVLSAHVGNWDLAGMALARRFGDVTVYVERLRPQGVYEFYRRTRRRHGCTVVDAGSGSRTALRTLQRNGIVGIVADRGFGAPTVRVPFGRGELDVPTGGIRLALRHGAALHSIFCLRDERGHTCHLQAEILPERDAGPAGIERAAALFAERLQDLVRRHPDQWCLLHPTLEPVRRSA